MEFVGGIEGFNYNPISNYNNVLKGNASFSINTDTQSDFDKILNAQQVMQSKQATNANSAVQGLMNSIQTAFGNGLNSVNDARLEADAYQEAFARGEDVSVHDMMISSEKATLSMQMAMQLRNKIIAAYTDLKNISI